VRVDGASGDRASVVNGVFALEEELYNGRALYRKVGDPHRWLRFAPDRTWVISDTVAKDANNNDGFAFSSSFGLSLPTDSSVWEVLVDGKFVKQAAVRVQPASEQVGEAGRARVCVAEGWCRCYCSRALTDLLLVHISLCACVCVCVCVCAALPGALPLASAPQVRSVLVSAYA